MALVAELAEISRQERRGENWLPFTAVLSRMSSALGRLEAENGACSPRHRWVVAAGIRCRAIVISHDSDRNTLAN